MAAYSGTQVAQDKIKDKNHDGIVEPDEKTANSQPVTQAAKLPGTGLVLDTSA